MQISIGANYSYRISLIRGGMNNSGQCKEGPRTCGAHSTHKTVTRTRRVMLPLMATAATAVSPGFVRRRGTRPTSRPRCSARVPSVQAKVTIESEATARGGGGTPWHVDASDRSERPATRTSKMDVIGRRVSIAGLGAATLGGALPAAAVVQTPKGYDDPLTTPGGWNLLVSDGDTLGCAYTVEWPSGWCALSDLSSARTVGVDASFKNPTDEASTLAVFISDAKGQRTVADQGTLDKVAAGRADSAPRQVCIGKRTRKTRVGDDGATALTYDVETKVGGGTAGRFGSAVELVGITVYGGKEYLIRATASYSAWPQEKTRLRRAVESFRITGKC